MNISEIAQMAGVSRAAVSRYLNNGYISEEKKQRIKKVIEETGYKPSVQAQMLRTKKSRQIGVIVPKISSEAVSRIVDGITEAVAREGFQVILGNTSNDTAKETEFLHLFKNNHVDGMIFIATYFGKEQKALVKKLEVPLIVVGQQSDVSSCVFHDDFGAAKALTSVMIEAGSRNIGYIGVTTKDKAAGLSRRQGFLKAFAEYGMAEPLPESMLEGMFTMESGYQLMKKILGVNPDIDGVFCATDSIAVGAMECLKEAGKRIPEDVRITGVGDTRMSKVITPRLTTAHLQYRTSGIEAGEMLLQMLKNEKYVTKEVKLGYSIIERESC